MTDTEQLDEATLARAEASIRATADAIVRGFEREQVPTQVALAICGVVVGRLLDRSDPKLRAEFIACLEDLPDP
jgi:hypothetical protein